MATKTKANRAAKTLTVVLKKSTASCTKKQIACVKGLGLRKLHHQRTLEDTPAVRGMINKVKHMVAIV